MTLKQASRLVRHDTFRRPSTNPHDVDGFRKYTVVDETPEMMTVRDQHGYETRIAFLPYMADWLKTAEIEPDDIGKSNARSNDYWVRVGGRD